MKISFHPLFLAASLMLAKGALGVQREFPDDGVAYDACLEELIAADADQDGFLKIEEYEVFVQAYKERILCEEHLDSGFAEQEQAFHAIACMCRCREGSACCEGDNAQIATAGADDPDRTFRQHSYLTTVCQVTDGSILEPRCSEEANAAISKSSEDDSKIKGSFVVVIAVVAGVLGLGLGLYLLSLCRRQKNTKSQPIEPAAEKEQDETVAEDDDDATEIEEHP